jgi:large subunit ribosomal protein L6
MSRIGKTPIEIPKDVTVTVTEKSVVSKGAKGELVFSIPSGITVKQEQSTLFVENHGSGKPYRALHGFVRAAIANDITGVSKGWEKVLELSGVGYRAITEGPTLVLSVGLSHTVKVNPPEGVAFAIKEGKIIVSGINKQLVGQTAANIREIKKPEPYKGKGIKYSGEYIRKKAGKAAKAVGGAA